MKTFIPFPDVVTNARPYVEGFLRAEESGLTSTDPQGVIYCRRCPYIYARAQEGLLLIYTVTSKKPIGMAG